MSNYDVIVHIIMNLCYHSPGPTGNHWDVSLPASFQETVDEAFEKFKKDDHYEMGGNYIKFICKDYD